MFTIIVEQDCADQLATDCGGQQWADTDLGRAKGRDRDEEGAVEAPQPSIPGHGPEIGREQSSRRGRDQRTERDRADRERDEGRDDRRPRSLAEKRVGRGLHGHEDAGDKREDERERCCIQARA